MPPSLEASAARSPGWAKDFEVFLLIQGEEVREYSCGNTLYLFTSAPLAGEYSRVMKLDAEARSILSSRLAEKTLAWEQRGVRSFVLDRCARCSAANFVPLEILSNREQLGQFWAFTLSLQVRRSRALAVSAFRSLLDRRLDDIVPKLKELRDHVNAGCAKVHYTLALLHTAEAPEQRQGLLELSKRRLIELGREDLADDLPDGTAGLLRGFAVLREMAEGDFSIPLFRSVNWKSASVSI
jgi:hypothetical protein